MHYLHSFKGVYWISGKQPCKLRNPVLKTWSNFGTWSGHDCGGAQPRFRQSRWDGSSLAQPDFFLKAMSTDK